MNLGELVAGAFAAAPDEAKKPIAFTDRDGNTITGQATGVPASGTPADGFAEATMIRDKNRRVSVLLPADSDPPKSGMTADWDGQDWRVSAVSPSMVPNLYRVTIGR